MPKSEPLLADRLLAAGHRQLHLEPHRTRQYQDKIRRAEKMVFDTAASIRVGEVLRDIPELLVEQIQFARAPFDLTWIEYDSLAVWNTLSPGRDIRYSPWDNSYDTTVGLLVDHNKITVWPMSADGKLGRLGFNYYLNTEWRLEDQLDFCEKVGLSRLGIDMWLWGSTWSHFSETGQSQYLRVLRDTNKVEIDLPPHMPLNPKAMAPFIQGTQGDFKNSIALLLMLNQPRVTRYVEVPRRRGWIGNKPKPFMAYHSITVSLDAKDQTVKLARGDGEGLLRRRHRVRGHYCQNQEARDYSRIAGCIHEWQPTDEDWTPMGPAAALTLDPEHWVCKVCDGKRWWRAAHERGDGGTGYVEHPTYRIGG